VPAHLDICGDGAPRFTAFLQGVIAEEDVGAHVTLHGRVDRDVVRRFCASHDVLVFPSEWDEPFAAVPVEAMSSGLAVVATTAGGTPEAIVHGETGLLVPPRDPEALAEALRRLAGDDALRQQLGQRAAQVARERFDLKTYVESTGGVLPGRDRRRRLAAPTVEPGSALDSADRTGRESRRRRTSRPTARVARARGRCRLSAISDRSRVISAGGSQAAGAASKPAPGVSAAASL
jgi:hypothetical protein